MCGQFFRLQLLGSIGAAFDEFDDELDFFWRGRTNYTKSPAMAGPTPPSSSPPKLFLDEASVKMIWKYRKLFQCRNVLVQLGCGATTLFSYSVYIHCCLLVIASNTWRSKLSALPAEDRDWLEFNQVLVEVHEPLCLWTVRSHMFGFRAIFWPAGLAFRSGCSRHAFGS